MCIHFLPAEYNNHAAFASDMPKSWSSKWCSLTQKTYYLPLGLALPPTPSLSLSLFCTRSVLSCWARTPLHWLPSPLAEVAPLPTPLTIPLPYSSDHRTLRLLSLSLANRNFPPTSDQLFQNGFSQSKFWPLEISFIPLYQSCLLPRISGCGVQTGLWSSTVSLPRLPRWR